MEIKQTRVVFFGTPELAVPMLERLAETTTVIAAVTQTDKPKGRSQELSPSPVKVAALKYGIPVLQPKTLKREKSAGETFYQSFCALKPDVAVVVAYGKIIPAEYLSIPRFGFVNVHPSLLPSLRGPSPMQYAILQGVNPTGISIMVLDAGMDTGPVLAQELLTLSSAETAETLHDRVQIVGADLLVRTLKDYITGTIHPKQQNDSLATYSHLIDKSHGQIDWTRTDTEIERMIRAFTPWPGAFTYCQGKRIKILSAHLEHECLVLDTVQPEGKRPMSYGDFARGYSTCTLDAMRTQSLRAPGEIKTQ